MKHNIWLPILILGTMQPLWSKGTAYIDDLAVYEDAGDGTGYKLDHQNITGPYGQEGRILNDGASAKAFFKDHLGSTRVVMNDGGGAQESYEYYSYGNIITKLGFQRPTREKFTGKEFDEDGKTSGTTGMQLSYFGGRYYDGDIGLWISTDPEGQFHSPYTYASDNPGNKIDVDGKWSPPIHFVGTFWGAMAAGESFSNSFQIAKYAVMADFTPGSQDNTPAANIIHGMQATGENLSAAEVNDRSNQRVFKLVTSGTAEDRNLRLGEASHTAADMYSHKACSYEEHLTLNPFTGGWANFMSSLGHIANDWGNLTTGVGSTAGATKAVIETSKMLQDDN